MSALGVMLQQWKTPKGPYVFGFDEEGAHVTSWHVNALSQQIISDDKSFFVMC